MKLFSILFFAAFNLTSLFSQDQVRVLKIEIEAYPVIQKIKLDKVYNGVTIAAENDFDFSRILLFCQANDSLIFNKDIHAEKIQSNLQIFEATRQFELKNLNGVKLTLYFQYVPTLILFPNTLVNKRADCEMPVGIISQSFWRQGLDAPVPGREKTKTHHCVIHHSAGGNNATDFTQLVRSYYVQHTQVNGWDDIAYNYLIAPNGDIYAGRDPEKNDISQDNVLGAHFCSKNANTMGVCLIGDYQNTAPNDSMLGSLIELLTWKYSKDTLAPNSETKHPYNSGNLLKALCGHRDGCATECPGNMAYSKLDSLRIVLVKNYNDCLPFVNLENESNIEYESIIIQNPVSSYFKLNIVSVNKDLPFKIYSSTGQMLYETLEETFQLENGIYFIQYFDLKGRIKTEKILVN